MWGNTISERNLIKSKNLFEIGYGIAQRFQAICDVKRKGREEDHNSWEHDHGLWEQWLPQSERSRLICLFEQYLFLRLDGIRGLT